MRAQMQSFVGLVGLLATVASSALAQTATQPQRESQAPSSAPPRDTVPWFTRRDLAAASGALAATLALAPFDQRISREFTDPSWERGTSRQRAAGSVASLGGRGPFLVSGALYAVGLTAGVPALTRIATHNLEAVTLGGGLAALIRGITGRALPNAPNTEHFSFGRGFHDNNGPYVSFPSGHTTAAFAMATTLSAEIAEEAPSTAKVVKPVMFTLATAVGVARVAQREHWPTDLPLAMFIGIWSGEAVQAHTHRQRAQSMAMRGIFASPAGDGRTFIGWSWRAANTN